MVISFVIQTLVELDLLNFSVSIARSLAKRALNFLASARYVKESKGL